MQNNISPNEIKTLTEIYYLYVKLLNERELTEEVLATLNNTRNNLKKLLRELDVLV